MLELEKVYDPKTVEDKIYKMWTDGGYFTGSMDPGKKPFTIVIPPPNVTGQLHLGHAFNNTLQDILIRFKRMQGFAALWVPGTDHAGIATQIRVEEELRNEGQTRHDLGREKFLGRVWEWKNIYGGRIVDQLKKLGSSCDWSRERFTMDDGCSRAVREVFVSLYEDGLIYKGNRIINWCPNCATALSDAEVEHEDYEGHLWHIMYPLIGSDDPLSSGHDHHAESVVSSDIATPFTGSHLVVATTRPETMLGDTAIAVHPHDRRYSHLIGKTVMLPLMDREIPIIADEYVDKDFGTGCVKITPCHDPNDFEVGQRHNLDRILVMDEGARIINSGKYNGLDRYEARRTVLADLEELGLIAKIVPHSYNIGTCYRCKTNVEPLTSEQWFVSMKPLAAEAIEVVENGGIGFVPERFTKIYSHWMENVRDWCISRQLWWGHRIPAWYCDCGHVTVTREDPEKCGACGNRHISRDEDVLDTWFSSALWPFSTLGWPDDTEDLRRFYPTDVLVTGYDIIFFWVARMIFSGMKHMKQAPFHTVFINGLIRDSEGRKMSKSLGNGVDPIDLIETYGADALRFNIISGNSPGNDIRFYPERCEAMRNFANKIWNASRFVLMNITIDRIELPDSLELEDKWILSKLNTLAGEMCLNLEKFEIGVAASKIYDFIWDVFCDWYIELTKPRLQDSGAGTQGSGAGAQGSGAETQGSSAAISGSADSIAGSTISDNVLNTQKMLLYILTEILTLLHPFMPFITEEIYQALPHEGTSARSGPAVDGKSDAVLMIRKYPEYSDAFSFPREEADFESIIDAVRAVRARRAEMNVPPSKKPGLTIVTEKPDVFEAGRAYLGKLAYAGDITISRDTPADISKFVSVATGDARLYMPLSELIDPIKERQRIEKEISKVEADISRYGQKLSNESFVSKAPEQVVNAEREKLEKCRALLENLNESLNGIQTSL